MKYIAKAKGANRFKTLESISEFTASDFEKHELYEVSPVDPTRYGQILKEQKISELKTELQALGVDVNTLFQQQAPQQPMQTQNQLTNESPLLMADGTDARPMSTGVSEVINKETGKPFTMEEMRTVFEEFRAKIEKEVPEIMYSMCGDDGFKLVMSEHRSDIPKILPNGIPLTQVIG
jgi:hypothetical protein